MEKIIQARPVAIFKWYVKSTDENNIEEECRYRIYHVVKFELTKREFVFEQGKIQKEEGEYVSLDVSKLLQKENIYTTTQTFLDQLLMYLPINLSLLYVKESDRYCLRNPEEISSVIRFVKKKRWKET